MADSLQRYRLSEAVYIDTTRKMLTQMVALLLLRSSLVFSNINTREATALRAN